MYAVSDSLKRRVLGSHERRGRVTVLDNTTMRPVAGGAISGDTFTSGQVFVTGGSGARRTATIGLDNTDGIYTPTHPGHLFFWNRLIRVEQGILLEPGVEESAEWIPVGTFMIDRPGVNIEKGGITTLTLKVRDRWKMIDKAEYGEPGFYADGLDVQDALQTAAEYAGVPSGQIVLGGSTHTLGADLHYEEGDNVGDLMARLANIFGLRCYFDVNGYLVIDDQPNILNQPVVHHYRPGVDSIVTAIKRDLTDERFANHIVVASSSSDPDAPIIRAEAEDTRPGEPTSIAEIGRRTRRYASPMLTSQTIAQEIADLFLQRYLRFSEETSLNAVGLPYLDADDRVWVTHANAGLRRSPYLIESLDIPILGAESSLRLTAAHDV